ncbi:MAG: sulfite exporter TauE/SafE family protein [Bacteroidales bacterium]|nr:sulfite exporter TauE/SafE family protein [Bacteroidales bacterium]
MLNFILLHGSTGLSYSEIPILAGLVMSMIHVISGPDHLAAVTPLTIDSKKKSWSIGFSWGIGHTLGMLIIGIIFILLKEQINIEAISEHGEKFVGFLLIAIGIFAFLRIKKKHGSKHKHSHPHTHDNEVHIHSHKHGEEEKHTHKHKRNHRQNVLSALGIGIIHGVAGVSHLIAILPTLALPSKIDSVMYLSGFGAGTILAMVAYSVTLGIITQKTDEKNNKKLSIFLRIFGGSAAVIVGIIWIIIAF